MKKFLFSCVLLSGTLCADIKIDTKLIQNDQILSQDSTIIDEAIIANMMNNTNETNQSTDDSCEKGNMVCRLKSITADSATFNVVVKQRNDSGELMIIFNKDFIAPWNEEVTMEIPRDGESCLFSLIAQKN